MKKLLLCALALTSASAFAGEKTTIHCQKDGKNGQPAYAKADITFDVATDGRNDLRTITDLRGEIRAAQDKEEANSDDAYIGIFATKSVQENPKYRPVKYKDSSQFQNVDAKETRGAESGMWGSLIVPKKTTGAFEAHYVFQAGDHMGGTIHMDCRAER